MHNRTCTIDECDRPARSGTAAWCKMHYHRWYRHGSVDKVATRVSTRANGSKYRQFSDHAHPLAGTSGKVYVHRAVLYAMLGPGAQVCHWCSRDVAWDAPLGHPEMLQVDHLNSVRDDNRPENLVASCPSCNVARGAQARSDALRGTGWWSHNDTIAGLKQASRRPRVDPQPAS